MSVNDRKVFVMALMLVALMSVFVSVASAVPGTQTWYTYGPSCSDCMKKSCPTDWTSHTIADGGSRLWYTFPAECDLTMGTGTWVLYLNCDTGCDGSFDVEVVNKETGKVLGSKYNVAIVTGTEELTLDLDSAASGVDFKKGEHLQIKMWWDATEGSCSFTIYCGTYSPTKHGTAISSPSSDPGYPVPELSTLALFSVGLLALVGYVVYRRRRI